MGRIFGILLVVALVWVGLELYTEGPRGAFGGALAFLAADDAGDRAAPVDDRSVVRRAGDAVERAQREVDERTRRMLED